MFNNVMLQASQASLQKKKNILTLSNGDIRIILYSSRLTLVHGSFDLSLDVSQETRWLNVNIKDE